jgi:hypothetical protein
LGVTKIPPSSIAGLVLRFSDFLMGVYVFCTDRDLLASCRWVLGPQVVYLVVFVICTLQVFCTHLCERDGEKSPYLTICF